VPSGHARVAAKAVAARAAWFLAYVAAGMASLPAYEYLTDDPVDGRVLRQGFWNGIGLAIGVELARWMLRRRERRRRGGASGDA
jgi:hypothetical protein